MAKDFALDYIDVAERITEFRTKHPEGSFQQVALDFREVAGGWWVIYTAAAYRTPEDARPGIGTAWEPVPGRTPFTKDSEVQNAETAAWGRAIVAALAADTKRGIASAEEVRNRQAPQPSPLDEAKKTAWAARPEGWDADRFRHEFEQYAATSLGEGDEQAFATFAKHLEEQPTEAAEALVQGELGATEVTE